MSTEHIVTMANLGQRSEKVKTHEMRMSEKTGAKVRTLVIRNNNFYTPRIVLAELEFIIIQDIPLTVTIWHTGAPYPKAYGFVFKGRQVFVTKRMAIKAGLLSKDGEIVAPHTILNESIEPDIHSDPMTEDFETLNTTTNETDIPSAPTTQTKPELEAMLQQIYLFIGKDKGDAGKIEVLAFRKFLVEEGILKNINLSKCTKPMVQEAIEVARDYLAEPFEISDELIKIATDIVHPPEDEDE